MEADMPTQQQREDTLIMQVKPIELINGLTNPHQQVPFTTLKSCFLQDLTTIW